MKTKTKIQSIVSMLLMTLMLASIGALSASAASRSYIDITFYKPSGWADSIKIHVWNAACGNTQWPGAEMESLGNNKYHYRNASASSCDFVINDGNGRQTSDLHAAGSVSVKDGVVIENADEMLRFNFKKPSDWSSDVKVYYYTNDANEISFDTWPGVPMNAEGTADTYYYNTTAMKNARVIFTDGTHQYPPAGQPGIPVSEGQELLFADGKYTVNDYSWAQVSQPVNRVYVNQECKVKVIMDRTNSFLISFFDENGTYVNYDRIESVTQTCGKIIYEYVFTFAEVGRHTLDVKYYYHSGYGFTGKTVDVNVIPLSSAGMAFSSSSYDLVKGQEFTLTADYVAELTYTVFNDNGQQLTPVRTYQSVNPTNGKTNVNMVFVADQLGQFQKLHLYSHNWRNPVPADTGAFVMVDVWELAD